MKKLFEHLHIGHMLLQYQALGSKLGGTINRRAKLLMKTRLIRLPAASLAEG